MYPNGIHSDPDAVINLRTFQDWAATYPHLFGLLSSALIILMPYPWALFFFHHIVNCYYVWSAVSSGTIILIWVFFIKVASEYGYQLFLVNEAMNTHKVRVTMDDAEWSKSFNEVARMVYIREKSDK